MNRPSKNFRLSAEQIRPLATGLGAGVASDMITVHGSKVGFMYRQEPMDEVDSGWCFTAGVETQEYMDEPANHAVYDVNTIANYDPEIIPFLDSPIGSAYERDPDSGEFVEIDFDPDDFDDEE